MLRIAVPNKGSLSESAVAMLRECGYRTRRDSKELVVGDPDNDVEFFYLRPRDIAVYVGEGTLDAVSYTHLDVYKRQPRPGAAVTRHDVDLADAEHASPGDADDGSDHVDHRLPEQAAGGGRRRQQ